jgi:hypothetical protein
MKNSSERYLIAVPTIKLKQEITKRLFKAGVDVMAEPSLSEYTTEEQKEEFDRLYKMGIHKAVGKKVNEDSKEFENLGRYLDDKRAFEKFEGSIVTTHKKLTLMQRKELEKYRIIIDEDILTTLMEIKKVKIKDIMRILGVLPYMNTDIDRGIVDYFKYLGYSLEYNKVTKVIPPENTMSVLLNKICTYPKACIDSNIGELFNANAVYLHEDETISYIVKNDILTEKAILLSATVEAELYERYFGIDNIVKYKCQNAKYLGKIVQVYDESFSRTFINDNELVLQEIKDMFRGMDVITFKSCKEEFDKILSMHFGNTSGFNGLAGKDVLIVGTPFQVDFKYKLYAAALGEIGLGSECEMRHQPTEWKAFKFHFMTYKNELLSKIQLWLIDTELEQAVGRARLLRNDCTVYLFSSFPVNQAELITYADICKRRNYITRYEGKNRTNAEALVNK